MKKTLLKTTALVAFLVSASAAASDYHFTLQNTGNVMPDERGARNLGIEADFTWDVVDGVELGLRGVHKFIDGLGFKKQLHSAQLLGQIDLFSFGDATVFFDVAGGISWMLRDSWTISGFTFPKLNETKGGWFAPWHEDAQLGFSGAGHIGARVEIADGISFVAKVGLGYEKERALYGDFDLTDAKQAAADADAAAKKDAAEAAKAAATKKADVSATEAAKDAAADDAEAAKAAAADAAGVLDKITKAADADAVAKTAAADAKTAAAAAADANADDAAKNAAADAAKNADAAAKNAAAAAAAAKNVISKYEVNASEQEL
jgi:hypothetical protein